MSNNKQSMKNNPQQNENNNANHQFSNTEVMTFSQQTEFLKTMSNTHFIIQIDIQMTNEVYESEDVQFFIKEMSMPRFTKMLKDSYKATVLGAQSEKIEITYGIKQ